LTVYQWFSLKTNRTICQWFSLRITGTISSGLASKSVATVFSGLVSKPVATVSPSLTSKSVVVGSWIGPQNRLLWFGDLGLKITAMVSWFMPQDWWRHNSDGARGIIVDVASR
jgi:hypothetical protein